MLLHIHPTRLRVIVRLKGTGRFWCLYCETERDYEHRWWRRTVSVLAMPLWGYGGDFILCLTCDSAFDLEVLDESSTAECHELMLQVPLGASDTDYRPRPYVKPASPIDPAPAAGYAYEPEPDYPNPESVNVRPTVWEGLSRYSGYSGERRH